MITYVHLAHIFMFSYLLYTYFFGMFSHHMYLEVRRSVALVVAVSTAGMGAPSRGEPSPRGRGGSPPRPPLWGGGVPRPAPPRKNDQNRGEVAGQNKYPNLNFLQKRKEVMEQYYNTEQCQI